MKTPEQHELIDAETSVYSEKHARSYDEKRFGTKQGRTVQRLEMHQLKLATSLLQPGAQVLEIGAGTGRFSIELASNGFNVVALEPSEEMLAKAKEKVADTENIEFVQRLGDATGYDDDSFDFVFSARVLNRLKSKAVANNIVREKVRVTKPGGMIYLDIATKGFIFPRPGNPILYSTKEIANLAEDLNCDIVSKRGMFVLSSQFIAKLPSFILPLWEKLEVALSRPLYGISSKSAVVLKKKHT